MAKKSVDDVELRHFIICALLYTDTGVKNSRISMTHYKFPSIYEVREKIMNLNKEYDLSKTSVAITGITECSKQDVDCFFT